MCGMRVTPVSMSLLSSFNVTIDLTSIDVLDDCDNVSPGDWIVFMNTIRKNMWNEDVLQSVGWPTDKVSANVNTRSTVRINRRITSHELKDNEKFSVTVGAIDCDSDT